MMADAGGGLYAEYAELKRRAAALTAPVSTYPTNPSVASAPTFPPGAAATPPGAAAMAPADAADESINGMPNRVLVDFSNSAVWGQRYTTRPDQRQAVGSEEGGVAEGQGWLGCTDATFGNDLSVAAQAYIRATEDNECIEMRRAPPVPLVNGLLATLYTQAWPTLIGYVVAAFVAASLPFAALRQGLGCHDADLLRAFATSISILGGSANTDAAESLVCVGLDTGATFAGLALQGLVFAVLVNKFSNPKVDLTFTKRMCEQVRDGQTRLSFRMAHPQGHFVSQLAVSAQWLCPSRSVEGESFVERRVVGIDDDLLGRQLIMPTVVSHTIDDSSPLAPFRNDLANSPGLLRITVTGWDEILRTPFTDVRVYPLSQVVRGRWKPVVVRDFVTAGREGTRAAADLGDLDEILTPIEIACTRYDEDDWRDFQDIPMQDSSGNYWVCNDTECVPYMGSVSSGSAGMRRTLCTDV